VEPCRKRPAAGDTLSVVSIFLGVG